MNEVQSENILYTVSGNNQTQLQDYICNHKSYQNMFEIKLVLINLMKSKLYIF